MRNCFILLISVCLSSIDQSFAQEQRVSPLSVASSRYKDTYIKIVYSQPQKKGRQVFGKLVPYDAVWRTGANEATELTVTTDITLGGSELKAGTYSIFTIPKEETWTIIINSDLGLWGAYNYNPKRDVMRLEVPSAQTEDVAEAFTITIDPNNNRANMILRWDRTKVSIPILYPEPKPKP